MTEATAPLDFRPFFERHPILETDRLILRELRDDDAKAIFEYASDAETTKFMIFPTHTSIADAENFIQRTVNDFAAMTRIEFGIELKSTGKLIGCAGFHHFSSNHHSVELGYILNRAHWGSGYITEVVNRMLRFAFDEMQVHSVHAVCDIENMASSRVLERCGFTHDATFRDHEFRRGRYITLKVFSKLVTDQ
jgi:[ribosomal protein S5]-alanine N-acetyltransferase